MVRHYLLTITALDVGIGIADGDLRWWTGPFSEDGTLWPLMVCPAIYWAYRGSYKINQSLEIILGCS